jgi:hypothetical protein
LVLFASFIATLVACGGSGGTSTPVGPSIIVQPVSRTVSEGTAVSFSVSASGADVTYQWYKNGAVIPSATSTTYSIASAASTNIGSYYAVATNVEGAAASNIANLSVTGTGGVDGTVK